MANIRIKDLTTQARSVASDDFLELDGATNASRRISPNDSHGQFRNALAKRGAIAGDGTSGAGISRDCGSAVAIAASDPVAYDIWLQIPSSNPSAIRGIMGQSDTARNNVRAGAVDAYLDTSRNFIGRLYGATTSDYRQISVALANWSGKWTHLFFDVRGGALYVNGIAATATETTAGSPPAWSAAVTGTVINVGTRTSGNEFVGPMADFHLWNQTVAPADVLEIYELGGGVPERLKWASMDCYPVGGAAKVGALDGTTTTANDGAGGGGVGQTAVAGARTGGSGNYVERITANGGSSFGTQIGLFAGFPGGNAFGLVSYPVNTAGQQVRVRGWSKINSGAFTFTIGGVNIGATSSWTQFDLTVAIGKNYRAVPCVAFAFSGNVATDSIDFDDMQVTALGAVIHLPLDAGGGFQLRDNSANRLHALMTATGVSHVLPLNGPFRARFQSNTNGNQQLGGQVVIPANAQILRVRAKASTGTPNVTLGTSSGGAQIVASVALSTAWQTLTIALTGGQVGSSNISLWAGSNSTATIDWDVAWEPLSS